MRLRAAIIHCNSLFFSVYRHFQSSAISQFLLCLLVPQLAYETLYKNVSVLNTVSNAPPLSPLLFVLQNLLFADLFFHFFFFISFETQMKLNTLTTGDRKEYPLRLNEQPGCEMFRHVVLKIIRNSISKFFMHKKLKFSLKNHLNFNCI